jgi:hypothetical protein
VTREQHGGLPESFNGLEDNVAFSDTPVAENQGTATPGLAAANDSVAKETVLGIEAVENSGVGVIRIGLRQGGQSACLLIGRGGGVVGRERDSGWFVGHDEEPPGSGLFLA